ncbi:hypothetical protein BC828DRAFT_374849 [Blastocladiella britannica]|nr:hypothetical protein BC828DRAFT_374849 [Blastocladiella britannica]
MAATTIATCPCSNMVVCLDHPLDRTSAFLVVDARPALRGHRASLATNTSLTATPFLIPGTSGTFGTTGTTPPSGTSHIGTGTGIGPGLVSTATTDDQLKHQQHYDHSGVTIKHPALSRIVDLDDCRLVWRQCLVCGTLLYAVEDDDQRARARGHLLPRGTDRTVVVGEQALLSTASSLDSVVPSPAYGLVVLPPPPPPPSRTSTASSSSSSSPSSSSAATTAAATAVHALDAALDAYVARESAATDARIAAYAAAQRSALAASTDRARHDRDVLAAACAAWASAEISGTSAAELEAAATSTATPSSTSSAASAAPASTGLPLAPMAGPAALAARTAEASEMARARAADDGVLPVTAPVATVAAPRIMQTKSSARQATSSRSADTQDDDLFAFDDDDDNTDTHQGDDVQVATPVAPTAASSSLEPVPDTSDDGASDEEEQEADENPAALPSRPGTGGPGRQQQQQPPIVSLLSSSLPMSIPLMSSTRAMGTTVVDGPPPLPLDATTVPTEIPDVDQVSRAVPPHEYIARTYAPAPGASIFGSKPPGAERSGFSWRG